MYSQWVNSVLYSGSKPCALQVKYSRTSWAWPELPISDFVHGGRATPNYTRSTRYAMFQVSGVCEHGAHVQSTKKLIAKVGQPRPPLRPLFQQPCDNRSVEAEENSFLAKKRNSKLHFLSHVHAQKNHNYNNVIYSQSVITVQLWST